MAADLPRGQRVASACVAEQAERRELKKENQQLHHELRRKEKALAEAAALAGAR